MRMGIEKKLETVWIRLSIPPCALTASSIVTLAQFSVEFGTSLATSLGAVLSTSVDVLSGFWKKSLLMDSVTNLAMLEASVVDSLSGSIAALPISSSIWVGVLVIFLIGFLLITKSMFILSVMHMTLCIAILNWSVLGRMLLNILEVKRLPLSCCLMEASVALDRSSVCSFSSCWCMAMFLIVL